MLSVISKIIWSITSVFLMVFGLILSKKNGFVYFNIPKMLKKIMGDKNKENGVTPFQTLMVTLATKIGVGSILGVAISIYYGGIGSVFWLFISTFIVAPIVLAESYLGSKYKVSSNDLSIGGPQYYIEKSNKKLAFLYVLFLFLSYILGYIPIQINTIINSSVELSNINNVILSFVLTIILIIIVFRDTKIIIRACTIIVPIMSFIYIGSGFFVLLSNFSRSSIIFVNMIKSAFNIKSFGLGVLSSFIMGFQRGVFSSEAGTGTCAIASAISNTKDHMLQAYIQVIGIYFTNFFICGTTALIILTSNYQDVVITGGLDLVQYAFSFHFGNIGFITLNVSIILFALSTVITGYYCGATAFRYMGVNINKIFKFIMVLIFFASGIIKASVVWDLADILIAMMTILNIIGMFLLRKELFTDIKKM